MVQHALLHASEKDFGGTTGVRTLCRCGRRARRSYAYADFSLRMRICGRTRNAGQEQGQKARRETAYVCPLEPPVCNVPAKCTDNEIAVAERDRMVKVSEQVAEMQAQVESIRSRQDKLDRRLKEVIAHVSAVDARLCEIEQRLGETRPVRLASSSSSSSVPRDSRTLKRHH